MGARELSGLSTPQPINTHRRLDFPTKMLPAALHQKYIGPNDIPENRYTNQLEQAVSGVRNMMLSKSAKRAEEYPELAREKKLRVAPGRSVKVAEIGSRADREMITTNTSTGAQAPVIPFKDVAAEYFIMPLINRFWQYFQDSSTREARAINTGDRYRGAGTGMILSAMALEKMLMTLSLLIHAARHSAVFLSVLAPEAIELGITIGARHLATPSNNPLITDLDTKGLEEGSKTEAQVLAAALELVLVSLDVSVELDKGRTLAIDKAELVLAAGEWASGVFEVENKGGLVSSGQGGMREGRVKATAAGVVVKVSEIGERWTAVGSRMR
jgi:telomere length regulation protein